MSKHQLFLLKGTIYPFDILVSIGGTNIEAIKAMKKKGVSKEDYDEFDSNYQGKTLGTNVGYYIVRLTKELNTPEGISDLVHEITHVTQFLMEHINTPLSEDTYESYAYYTAYIVKEIISKRWKFIGK